MGEEAGEVVVAVVVVVVVVGTSPRQHRFVMRRYGVLWVGEEGGGGGNNAREGSAGCVRSERGVSARGRGRGGRERIAAWA